MYNFIERNTITGDLKKLNEKRSPKVVDILYPEKMQLGDTLDLTPNTVLRFFELDDFETIKGTLILKEILVRNDETLAIFDIDIYFYGLVDEADKAYMTLKMNGILERSLTHFYDKKVEMLGMFKMKGNIGEGEYLTMETPATLIITQILH